MVEIRNIVLGVAEPRNEEAHIARGVRIAETVGARLHVVHAFHIPDPALYPYPEMALFSPEAVERLREGALSGLEAAVARVTSSDRVTCSAVATTGEQAVLDAAEAVSAELIMVGATRRGRVGKAVLGTTAQRIVRTARAPVLVVHDPRPKPVRRVLLTTDLSPLSVAAFEQGMGLLKSVDPRNDRFEIRSLLVVAYDMPLPPPLGESAASEVAAMKLESFVDRVAGSRASEVERRVRIGSAGDEILAEAKEWGADLLIVGTHGRTGASRFLIGSVAETVLRDSLCDVLVIPNPRD